VAAVLFTTLADVLDARQFIIPGVGVREGVLHELAAAHFGPASAHDERAEALRQQARRFAARMHSDAGHCEHVRRLAAQLFDQLAPVHELPSAQRVTLELGALLHDVGIAVNARGHHKHGEYLVRHGDIPGLSKHQQAVVACLVRYHGESMPDLHHRLYSSLAEADRTRVRQLAALLRIAVALDAGETQVVRRVDAKIQRRTILIRVATTSEAQVNLRELRRKARFLESEFGLPLRFACVRRLQNGNAARRNSLLAGRSAA
jgi:exopolyphosphatase/guanosine-5'-triphosphate,3'-diphosphate pyrophosphatase